jgi:hypothetical protein
MNKINARDMIVFIVGLAILLGISLNFITILVDWCYSITGN